MKTDKHIVAIDLGTSKIALSVAKVNGNDVQIVYYKETPTPPAGIKYSSIFNPKLTSERLKEAITDAEDELGIKITQAVVGMPKYPVRQETGTSQRKDRGFDTDITPEDIAELKRFAQDYPFKDEEKEAVYGAVAQSFSDGENFQIIENDIIGMTSDVLEGHFKIFIGKKSDLSKIDTVLRKCDICATRKYFTADSTAKAVLNSSEMENGVAMIDFGGGCTSVSIYHGNVMRHYASIPFGGKNITNDIKTECQIHESLAENIKLAYGACMPDKLQNLSEKIIHIRSNSAEPDKQLPVKYLSEIITARVEEIIMAILYEIESSGFADKLRSGIVVTGGGAQIANLGNFIYDLTGYRVRTGYPKKLFSCHGCDGITETSATTSIGLILAAKEESELNCAVADESIRTPETPVEDTTVTEVVEVNPVRETLFDDNDIEKVVPEKPVKKNKPEKTGQHEGTLSWKDRINKVGNWFGGLYDQVSQDIENEGV